MIAQRPYFIEAKRETYWKMELIRETIGNWWTRSGMPWTSLIRHIYLSDEETR